MQVVCHSGWWKLKRKVFVHRLHWPDEIESNFYIRTFYFIQMLAFVIHGLQRVFSLVSSLAMDIVWKFLCMFLMRFGHPKKSANAKVCLLALRTNLGTNRTNRTI